MAQRGLDAEASGKWDPYSYTVVFVLDDDGIWRLKALWGWSPSELDRLGSALVLRGFRLLSRRRGRRGNQREARGRGCRRALAEEAANGGFYIDESPGIDFNPFTRVVDPPSVIAFKPGYVALVPWNTVLHGYPTFEGLAESLRHGALIRLTKAHSREEEKRFDSLVDLGIDMDTPHSRIPELMKALNAELRRLGLPPYQD